MKTMSMFSFLRCLVSGHKKRWADWEVGISGQTDLTCEVQGLRRSISGIYDVTDAT